MRIVLIKPGQPALLTRGLAHLVKGLLLDRSHRAATEDRDAATSAVNQAVELKRIIGDIDDDAGAALVIGGSMFLLPGLMQIDQACDELFGTDGTPDLLRDAITAHTATIAIGMASASWVGQQGEALLDAAKELLEELGEGSAVDVKPQTERLREAVDNIEACADPSTFGQEQMNGSIDGMRKWMPGFASWIATTMSLFEKRIADAVAPLTAVNPNGGLKAWIGDNWDNQDLDHADFRIEAAQRAGVAAAPVPHAYDEDTHNG